MINFDVTFFVFLSVVWEPGIFSNTEDWTKNKTGSYMDKQTLSKLNDFNSMVVKCTVNGKDCEFEWYFDYKYYICYRIRTEGITDRKLELRAVLYTGRPLKFSPQRGFNLFVENATRLPLMSTPILLTIGLGRRIDIKRTSYEQYPTPYSQCQVLDDEKNTLVDSNPFNRSIFDMVVERNYSYTRATCLAACTQLVNNMTCSCQNYDNFVLEDVKFCSVRFRYNFPCVYHLRLAEYCLPRCPLESAQNVFSKNVASYKYPLGYFDAYKSAFTGISDFNTSQSGQIVIANLSTYMYTTYVEFTLSYDSTQHEKYSEEPKMSGEELLGVLGGHLHLFLGMSAMSFVELVELMLAVCARLVLGKKY